MALAIILKIWNMRNLMLSMVYTRAYLHIAVIYSFCAFFCVYVIVAGEIHQLRNRSYMAEEFVILSKDLCKPWVDLHVRTHMSMTYYSVYYDIAHAISHVRGDVFSLIHSINEIWKILVCWEFEIINLSYTVIRRQCSHIEHICQLV